MKHRSELLKVYSNFAKMVETQFSKRIKIFQSNNALEYTQLALPFNSSESISTDIFDLIHSNVWAPSSISNIGGSRYFIIFVDDYSCYNWIFNMKHRSELLQVYSNFAKMVET